MDGYTNNEMPPIETQNTDKKTPSRFQPTQNEIGNYMARKIIIDPLLLS